MEEGYCKRLEDEAKAIEAFRSLDEEEQKWLMPLLRNGIKNTLKILELIKEEELTFEEIANYLECHPHTVSQKLNALARGGCDIDLTDFSAYAPVGRPRKLARQYRDKEIDKLKKIVKSL